MAKVGRPKKQGTRYKNGRLTRSARAAANEDPMAVAVAARMRHYGIGKDEALGVRRADTKEGKEEQRLGVNWGFALGRAYKRQYITKAQYLAGSVFAEHMRAYMLTKGLGCVTPQAFDPLRRGASLNEDAVHCETEARDYLEALAQVDKVNPGRSATFLVMGICLAEASEHLTPRDMGVFREGLNAVARVIERRQKVARRAA